ncbi:MAG TPA: MarR family transcriptional regulator [Caldilineaceae bacterium]|nr:MarR family transcriptional regulator [Caldilineaceae bacterium]
MDHQRSNSLGNPDLNHPDLQEGADGGRLSNRRSDEPREGDVCSSDVVARELIDVVPQVMQALRAEIRRQRGPDLSVLQLRVLVFLNRHPGAPLSAVAEHVGLTLPSMSSQVTGLVGRNLINRSISAEDRRFVTLTLTDQGKAVLAAAVQAAQERFAEILKDLSPEECTKVMEAMAVLRRIFSRST